MILPVNPIGLAVVLPPPPVTPPATPAVVGPPPAVSSPAGPPSAIYIDEFHRQYIGQKGPPGRLASMNDINWIQRIWVISGTPFADGPAGYEMPTVTLCLSI